jgi:hypothetical protein
MLADEMLRVRHRFLKRLDDSFQAAADCKLKQRWPPRICEVARQVKLIAFTSSERYFPEFPIPD